MEPASSWILVVFINHCATAGTPTHPYFRMVNYSSPISWLHFLLLTTSFFFNIIVDLHCCVNFCCTAPSYIYFHSFSHIIFHHGLSQETGYSSLCHSIGSHCSSILNATVCIYQPQMPRPSHSLPLGNHKSVPYVCESVSVL